MTDTLFPALLCAAQLLGYEGELPAPEEVIWWREEPVVELCLAATAGVETRCAGVTTKKWGKYIVVQRADVPFSWRVHEAMHVIQLHAGLPYPNEELVHVLHHRTKECQKEEGP